MGLSTRFCGSRIWFTIESGRQDAVSTEFIINLSFIISFIPFSVVELFGADTLDLFGKAPKENLFGKNNESSDESDPGKTFRIY